MWIIQAILRFTEVFVVQNLGTAIVTCLQELGFDLPPQP